MSKEPSTEDRETITVGVDRPAHEPPPSGLSLRIVGEGISATHRLPARGDVVIGRSDKADIFIDHASVSRRHAILHIGSTLSIEDLGSANGTHVSGRPLVSGEVAKLDPGEVIDLGAIMLVVQSAAQIATHPRKGDPPRSSGAIIVEDEEMRRLYQLIDRVAPANISVLILGETGAGKEAIAEAVHLRSPRSAKSFLRLNCAALAESLLESELFGHEKGAFTGAVEAKPGLLETAEGGTVFLDEVGELALSTQVKLLRVLEERQVLRVGGLKARPIDVRFVAATNRELEGDVERGIFRRDLYFRLNGISLVVPPLRDRVSEIEPLARSFVARACHNFGVENPPVITEEAIAALKSYRWPGNIRELRNVIERAVLLASGGELGIAHLPVAKMREVSNEPPNTSSPAPDLKSEVDAVEKTRILDTLERCGGNQTRAAKELGISRGKLLSRLESYGIPRPRKR